MARNSINFLSISSVYLIRRAHSVAATFGSRIIRPYRTPDLGAQAKPLGARAAAPGELSRFFAQGRVDYSDRRHLFALAARD